MTSTPEKSTEELLAAEAAAATKVSEAEGHVDLAFAAWKSTFLTSVRAAIHQQARHAAQREAERTLEMGAEAIASLKEEVAALADDVVLALEEDVTLERMSRPRHDLRGIRAVHEGPGAAHQELLVPVEEGLGRILESAGYGWRGWFVSGKSQAWNGPELDEAEKDLFRTLERRITHLASVRADLSRASERVTASRALDAWGD